MRAGPAQLHVMLVIGALEDLSPDLFAHVEVGMYPEKVPNTTKQSLDFGGIWLLQCGHLASVDALERIDRRSIASGPC